MSRHPNEKHNGLDELVFRYEVASQKGTVPFFEETVFCALADYFEKNRQLGKAQSILTDGLTQHPRSSELCLRRAELLLHNNQTAEARRWLEKAVEVFPDQFHQALARAEAFCHMGKTGEALAMLGEIRQRPEPRQRASDEMMVHLKEISKKFGRLKDVLLDEPGNEEALSELWYCVELSGQFAQSAALHERLIDLWPYNSRAWFNLGSAWENLEKADDALEAFEYSYLIDPDFRDAYEAFAKLATSLGHHKLALRAYREMTQRLGQDAETLVLMGKSHDFLGEKVKARQHFRRATILDDCCAEAYFQLGQIAAREGKLEESGEHLAKAVYLDSENEDYQAAVAEHFAAAGQPRKAVQHFEKSLVLCCANPAFWMRYARFHVQSGNWRRALAVVEDGLVNSYGPELAFAQAACLFKLGRRKAAFAQLEAVLDTHFDTHDALFGFAPELFSDAEIRASIARRQNTQN